MLYDMIEGVANEITTVLLIAVGGLMTLYHLATAFAQRRP
jgi:hypothetical protein